MTLRTSPAIVKYTCHPDEGSVKVVKKIKQINRIIVARLTLVVKSVDTKNKTVQVENATSDLCALKRGYSSRKEEIMASICTNCGHKND